MHEYKDNLSDFVFKIMNRKDFKKLYYYVRCMKKAPHGGVFLNRNMGMFLKYSPCSLLTLLQLKENLPLPIIDYISILESNMKDCSINDDDIFQFIIGRKMLEIPFLLYKQIDYYNTMYILTACNVIVPLTDMQNIYDVISSCLIDNIEFNKYFYYNHSRLIQVFVCCLLSSTPLIINNIDDILEIEDLFNADSKYMLTDLSNAVFERQGFRIGNEYYLYNVFFDTSIATPNSFMPKTIEIVNKANLRNKYFAMRCDKSLCVPYKSRVSTATNDSEKWRGQTLCYDNFNILRPKETVIHYDPKTLNKILVVVKKELSVGLETFYQVSVEELWNPDLLTKYDNVVLTTYIHGCYFPQKDQFDHVDFSVNQYSYDIYCKKYSDDQHTTNVSVDKYGEKHYKVWMLKGENIDFKLWMDLALATLDEPFRYLFSECFGLDSKCEK